MTKLYAQDRSLVNDDLYALAIGADPGCVRSYEGCIVNGVKFMTKSRDSHMSTQNSGVCVGGCHNDNDITFYGRVTEVLQLKYLRYTVFLFRCEWYNTQHKGVIKIDDDFTSIDVSKLWYESDPFILATQASHVFYVSDPGRRSSYQVVQRSIQRHLYAPSLFEAREEVDFKDDACQEDECLEVRVPDSTFEISLHARIDVQGVDIGTARPQEISALPNDDVDDSGVDETLDEYCSEDEVASSSDSELE